jgi:hypothetical protein
MSWETEKNVRPTVYKGDQIKADEMSRTCRKQIRNAYKTLVEKLERKRPLGRYRRRHRWEDNTLKNLMEI